MEYVYDKEYICNCRDGFSKNLEPANVSASSWPSGSSMAVCMRSSSRTTRAMQQPIKYRWRVVGRLSLHEPPYRGTNDLCERYRSLLEASQETTSYSPILLLHHDVYTVCVQFLIQKGGTDVTSASNLDIHNLLQCPGRVRAPSGMGDRGSESWAVDRLGARG